MITFFCPLTFIIVFVVILILEHGQVREALADIGPAVFNGGFSTFLAFILLANSKSHVFSTFFKVFFLVIVFGLFNGLLLLPVMLSLVGPAAYSQQAEGGDVEKKEEKEAFVTAESAAFKPIVKNGVALKEEEKEDLTKDQKERKGLES